MNNKIVALGAGQSGSVAAALAISLTLPKSLLIAIENEEVKKLDVAMGKLRDAVENNTFEIKNFHQSLLENVPTNHTPEREHGWYRQFEKKGKNRNYKKAI